VITRSVQIEQSRWVGELLFRVGFDQQGQFETNLESN
jgi:hypothetical protein